MNQKTNTPVIILIAINLFVSIFFFVVYPPLQTASGIYGFLAVISLFIYLIPNKDLQEKLSGISYNIPLAVLSGIGIGVGFWLLSKIVPGLSIATPSVPFSVGDSVRAIIVLFFAPLGEEAIFRGSLQGLILYLESKGKKITTEQFWFANVVQSTGFFLLHLLAYNQNWYNVSSFSETLFGISAVSGSLLAAFLFGLVSGFSVYKTKNLFTSIIAHFIVNGLLFVSLSVIF